MADFYYYNLNRINESDKMSIALGQCFSYAHKQALKALTEDNRNMQIIHAVVNEPFTEKHYPHAWIEENKMCKDWQTMKAGSSKFANVGWEKELFYETFKPTNIVIYTPEQLIRLTIMHNHTGPF